MSGKTRAGAPLGRGLASLIPQGPPSSGGAVAAPATPPIAASVAEQLGTSEQDLVPVPGARFAEIPVDTISPNPRQPRQIFDEDALEELKVSIREVGFLQPIVVREVGGGAYEIVMGERRWRAAQALGRDVIPAIVRDTRDDAMLRDALLENIHRANLNPLEEAAAYAQLLEEFGVTQEQLARSIGRSRPQISNTIRLLKLPAKVQNRVAAGILSAGHARALLSLERSEQQEALAERIVAEGMSVRQTEETVAIALTENAQDKKPAVKRTKSVSPGFRDLADQLSDHFETRVRVETARRKGRILIEFATEDDLERIVGMFGVPVGSKQ